MLIHWVLCGSKQCSLKKKKKRKSLFNLTSLVYFNCVKLLLIAHCSCVEVLPPKYICMYVYEDIKERKAADSLKMTLDNKSIRNVSE